MEAMEAPMEDMVLPMVAMVPIVLPVFLLFDSFLLMFFF